MSTLPATNSVEIKKNLTSKRLSPPIATSEQIDFNRATNGFVYRKFIGRPLQGNLSLLTIEHIPGRAPIIHLTGESDLREVAKAILDCIALVESQQELLEIT